MNMSFKGKEIDQLSAMTNIKQNITTAQKQEQNWGGGTLQKKQA